MIRTANVVSSISRNAGGLFYSVRRLAQAIAEQRKVEVHVLGLKDEFTEKDQSTWAPLQCSTYPVLGPKAFGYSPELKKELLEGEYKLLHIHGMWMYPSKVSLRWWEKYRRPYLVSPHGMMDPWALRNSKWKKAIANYLYQQESLERAACLRSLCDSETQSMRLAGFTQPICEIPNGVDLPDATKGGPAPWAKVVPEGSKVIFSLGRFHPKKGLPGLITAFSRLQQSQAKGASDWYLVLAGWDQDGHEDKLKDMVRAAGMERRILFPGPLFDEAKANAFLRADAFILPSFSEGLPIAVLEAWSYSLPVLMTPECNLPIGFEKSAALKVSTDEKALEESLRSFVALDSPFLKEMGARGRALVEAQFTWEQIGKEMSAVYLWLLNDGPAPACIRR